MKTVVITLERYQELYENEKSLFNLEAGGVDNWEWYGEDNLGDDYPSLEESLADDQKEARKLAN
jgi:hypothetical protein